MSLKIISQGFKRSVKDFNLEGIRKGMRGIPPSENDRTLVLYVYIERGGDSTFFKWQM